MKEGRPTLNQKIHATAYFNFLHTANWIELQVKGVLRPHDLTHAQFNILKILNGSHPVPLSANDIKERMIFKNPDVTRLIDRLVKKGFVVRAICADNRRKVDISISQLGMELLDDLFPKVRDAVKNFFEQQITVEEASELNRILDKMKD